ncbi:UDP-N-acetylglucosamine 2-epimerase [Pseudobutyrivibrio sp.]|uniref:UDP-N-acetylglucosamine 2-epimerase n=1 Tax=Pseudobutyrivibrio sp. TaxID=2014367 RepID=UPI001DA9FF8C|nr:UDP-N-acetylglucosamine 2-epimerase [Pseudobutyrivibrio sp.]MBE5910047.1 UDP-N-acetylglucosamine 2-epimerase (hydrolyzing) [Pseudobutyrivibrio sp.]
MKKVSFVTGSRADYGIVRKYLDLLNNDKSIELSLLVTGSLLSAEYGKQIELIYKDGFKVEKSFEIPISTINNKAVIHAMSVALDEFGEYFTENKPDLLIILGDRYEMLSVAIAAAMNRVAILHIHGGEATYGNYDEFIRHSITKMSLYHITATEEYRRRVIQLGENPERVFNLGSLGAENCINIGEDVPSCIKKIKNSSYFVVLFHPETLTNVSTEKQIEEVLNAIKKNSEYKYVFIGANADTNSDIIRAKVRKFVESNSNCYYYENLTTSGYHYLLKHSKALIGNSSSGIIEAPSLGIYTINIGERQAGRIRGNSVIDVKCDAKTISDAISRVINENGIQINNPYFKENAAINYYKVTLKILDEICDNGANQPKIFFDL